jgi:hypothetical protein
MHSLPGGHVFNTQTASSIEIFGNQLSKSPMEYLRSASEWSKVYFPVLPILYVDDSTSLLAIKCPPVVSEDILLETTSMQCIAKITLIPFLPISAGTYPVLMFGGFQSIYVKS